MEAIGDFNHADSEGFLSVLGSVQRRCLLRVKRSSIKEGMEEIFPPPLLLDQTYLHDFLTVFTR